MRWLGALSSCVRIQIVKSCAQTGILRLRIWGWGWVWLKLPQLGPFRPAWNRKLFKLRHDVIGVAAAGA